jgi:hypothetical protein
VSAPITVTRIITVTDPSGEVLAREEVEVRPGQHVTFSYREAGLPSAGVVR